MNIFKRVILTIVLTWAGASWATACIYCICDSCGAGSAGLPALSGHGGGRLLDSGILPSEVQNRSYLSYATEALDNLMQHGTDRYGTVHSDLLVSNLDVRNKTNPTAAQLAAADEFWRVDRRQRRAPGGSNFLHNQSVYSAMVKASQVTGNPSYDNFVDSNFAWAMTNLVDQNGMFWWGYHRHYDVHTDSFVSDGNYHEMHFVDVPLWERMREINPSAVETLIQAIWDRHVVNKNTGQINRHDEPGGLSFIMSSASFIDAFAFLGSVQEPATDIATITHPDNWLQNVPAGTRGDLSMDGRVDLHDFHLLKTGGNVWFERAELLTSYIWNSRNPNTDLVAHTTNAPSRWDGVRSATTTPGVYVPALMRAYEFSGDEMYREQAIDLLVGWAEYAYDPASGSFWGSLHLDGTPVPAPWLPSGYGQYEPRGLIDLWAPEFITAQHNTDAARTYALAYQQYGDPRLLVTAERWADLIRDNLPATQTLMDTWYSGYSEHWAPHGTYAEHYGHVIQFFTTMYEATDELHYLETARDVANEAISSLWYDGLFRGHPNKPYYEAVDGVGVLIESLIDLDHYAAQISALGNIQSSTAIPEPSGAVLISAALGILGLNFRGKRRS